jgi:sodium/potassium-transporting ATPase subunit alpha
VAYESFGFLGERVLGFAYRSFQPPKLATGASDKPAHARDGTHSSVLGAFAAGATAAAAADGGAPALPASLKGAASYDAVYASEEGAALLPTAGLVFVGLVSLVDPPRDGVKEAVERCRAASIKVTMVTGDHPITAEAIARQVSIITLPTLAQVNEGLAEAGEAPVADELTDPRVQAIVRAGSQIRGLTEAQWDALLGKQEVVFARTTPEQKLEIVEHYQRLGEVVAVTGDGVNDSPALKKANIGLAMGGADASDVAREAGDIILMDSNFASIVFAIEEGRVLFDNLKKSIAYTLAHLLPELLPVFLNLAFAFPLALPGLVILTIDLITEQGPAVSFASEPAESAVMLLPPRDMKRDRLVSTPLLLYTYLLAGVPSMVVCMIAYFCTYLWHGIPIATLAGSSSTYFQVPNGATPDLVVGGKVFNEELQYAIYMQSVGAWYATIVMNQFW